MSILTIILIYLACFLAPTDTKEVTIDFEPKEQIILNKTSDSKWAVTWVENGKKEPMCELSIKDLIMQITIKEKTIDMDVLKLLNVKTISELKELKEFKIEDKVYTIQKAEKSLKVISQSKKTFTIKW